MAISPDGKTLAFTDFRDNTYRIYTVDAEAGSAVRQISMGTSANRFPVFNPVTDDLLFIQAEPYTVGEQVFYRNYLWTFGLESGKLIQYSEGDMPSYFPDGKKVAITRANAETEKGEIWIIDLAKGSESVLLSSPPGGATRGYGFPVVSPDGQRIAFVSRSSSANYRINLDIYLANVDGTNISQLTFHPGNDLCPRWSGDGRSLFFLSQRGSARGEYNIWKMDLDLP